MAAYMIVLLNCRSHEWLDEYIKQVPGIFRRYGGEYVGVSASVKKLEGSLPAPQQAAIFSFPSTHDIEAFMNSAAYHPFKLARQQHSDAEIFIFDSK